jgi:hypothetical protein
MVIGTSPLHGSYVYVVNEINAINEITKTAGNTESSGHIELSIGTETEN